MNLFVAAFPRSGTTFLGKVLVNELGLYSSPESHFLFHLYRAIESAGEINKQQLSAILSKNFKYQVWNISPELPEVLNIGNFVAFYEELIACFNNVSRQRVRDNVTLDHTPENMINQGYINQFFPNSIQLHLIRDPRAVFASIKHVKWGPNTALSFIQEWERAERDWHARPQHTKVVNIKFEDFVQDPKPVIQELKGVLGNYQSDSNAQFILPGYTQKQHKLVSSGKGDTSRIQAWKDILTKRDIELIEGSEVAKAYFDRHGYQAMSSGRTSGIIERITNRTLNKGLKAVNRLKRQVDGDGY